MSTLQIKDFYTQGIEAYNRGDFDSFFAAFSGDYVHHNSFDPQITNLETYRQQQETFRSSFPDAKLVMDDLITEGTPESGKGAMRYHITGTGKGTYNAIPVEGKPLTFDGIMVIRLENGKVVEDWQQNDNVGIMVELGVMPDPRQVTPR